MWDPDRRRSGPPHHVRSLIQRVAAVSTGVPLRCLFAVKLKLAEVPDGRSIVVPVDDRLRIAVFRGGDRCAAINDRCPHAGGSPGEGAFDGTQVTCPLHAFRVSVWTGIGNAGNPVQVLPIQVDADDVYITLPDAP